MKNISDREGYKKLITNRFKFNMFLLMRLPLAFVAGLRVRTLSDQQAVVTIPFNYWTKNPFRSVYFAALAMAAELSTGVLAMMNVYKSNPEISMLVFDMKASFVKKAKTRIAFTCNEGDKITQAVARSVETNQGQTITVSTTGTDTDGNVVAEFQFTWTFKPKA